MLCRRILVAASLLLCGLAASTAACVGDAPGAPSNDAGVSADTGAAEAASIVDAGGGFCADLVASGANVLACSDFDEGQPAAAGWSGIELVGGATATAQSSHPFSTPDALTILAPQSASTVAGALYLAQKESSNTFDAKLHLRARVGAGCIAADAGATNTDASLVLARYDFYASGKVVYRVDVLTSPPSASPSKLTLALEIYTSTGDGGLTATGGLQETDVIDPDAYYGIDFEFHTGGGAPAGKLNDQAVAFPAALIGGQPFVAAGLLAPHLTSTCEVDVDDVAVTSL